LDDPSGHSIGYLKIAFQWAFFYLKNKATYYDAVSDMISQGGDTDTNAAIVGGLIGAAYGLQGID
jgi:ADP-ribosyl-[dinitrogen reductase] hydrolase